jgi:hypothetical protein
MRLERAKKEIRRVRIAGDRKEDDKEYDSL